MTNEKLKIGSLFSGYGGLDIAAEHVFNANTVWVSDIDKGSCKVLAHRYPGAKNIGDISFVDWSTVEPIDVLVGGSPCQDLSTAGNRAGLGGKRSGLWNNMVTAIEELRPQFVVWENVRGALSAKTAESEEVVTFGPKGGRKVGVTNRALGRVLSDLADIGYDAQWCGLRAADVGAAHNRFRIFLLAYPNDGRRWEHHEGQRSVPVIDSGSDEPLTMLPTPTRRDYKDHMIRREPHRPDSIDTLSRALVDFGSYADAVSRWSDTSGLPTPEPYLTTGRNGQRQLSAKFVEWMMGLPDGWVTDVPGITRNEALKLCGNGVVPQQAAAALTTMLSRLVSDG